MPTWILAKKELRLLLRDPKAAVILLAMPVLFILVLGVSLGEGFGQKPDDRLRIYLVDLDKGPPYAYDRPAALGEAVAWLAAVPGAGPTHVLGAAALAQANSQRLFPRRSWAQMVQRDLGQTAGIRVETISTLDEAEELVDKSKVAAVLVFGPNFSKQVEQCSFLKDGINPFFRDGVHVERLDMRILRDPTQQTAASIIDQVAQGTLLRVILPWMIGRAFERIGDPDFMELVGQEVSGSRVLAGLAKSKPLGAAVRKAIQKLFPKYDLTAKTWAALTRSTPHSEEGAGQEESRPAEDGLLKRGSLRYQLLVPSYTVMFAFFLVLTVGWLFVSERRQGTLKRLRASPLSRTQILLGKFVPCLALSVGQGAFLLAAGKLVFGMSWGPEPAWLLLVVLTTSLAAMGLALLVAALARTETQVAIYGTLLVLLLAGISGCLMGDRSLMPEQMQEISRITPHAWALDAYRQLLTNPTPNYQIVAEACAVLTAFGIGFILLAWGTLKLE